MLRGRAPVSVLCLSLRRVAEEGADPTPIVEDARINLTIATGQAQ